MKIRIQFDKMVTVIVLLGNLAQLRTHIYTLKIFFFNIHNIYVYIHTTYLLYIYIYDGDCDNSATN